VAWASLLWLHAADTAFKGADRMLTRAA